ncbi:thioredoxin family protein [Labilibaculum antarcticum]|uniref:Thioredoxin family protein n=1 Tax=Labilibaculum antarcticum TaxID=1717717 RepID=A0A1Y1CKJ9_9BACT|nr:thioredoxin family protein [Labilibaculum antarcticum]BAX79801.1 thioredoxin family protein [Labilibaculum antarcticum]
MKRLASLLIFLAIVLNLSAQNNTKEDSRINETVLYGQFTLDAFNMDLCSPWYTPEHDSYLADTTILKKLTEQNFENISISLILGSWCHDSHREVPRFIKILEEINYPFDRLQMYALDTDKTSPDFDAKANNVTNVPTAIISRNRVEIGRIIESPKLSLEKDLLKILSKN